MREKLANEARVVKIKILISWLEREIIPEGLLKKKL